MSETIVVSLFYGIKFDCNKLSIKYNTETKKNYCASCNKENIKTKHCPDCGILTGRIK